MTLTQLRDDGGARPAGLDLGNMKLRMRYEAFAGSQQPLQALHLTSGA